MSKYTWITVSAEGSERFDDKIKGEILKGICEHGLWTRGTDEPHCHRGVGSDFAPGHDAKLKSMLIEAGTAGETQVQRFDRIATGKVNVQTYHQEREDDRSVKRTRITEDLDWEYKASLVTLEDAANRYGFSWQVSAGIAKGQAKAQAKADRLARKNQTPAEAQEAQDWAAAPGRADTERQGQVKVGRWWYDLSTGQTGENGGALYLAKGGEIKEAPVGAEQR